MDVKSTLRVFHEADLKAEPGISQETTKRLVGNSERPSERIFVTLANFAPGTRSPFHWHLIEKFYFIISGRGVIKDIEGNSYAIGPGSVIYAPAGIEGSHEFDVEENMQLLAVGGTTDPQRNLQFTVDKSSKESCIELDLLVKRTGGTKFRSVY